ncbi:MAG: signal peptidase II [Clostridia bacterium]|nr:signal peptidase II [Clostridia bacterium]
MIYVIAVALIAFLADKVTKILAVNFIFDISDSFWQMIFNPKDLVLLTDIPGTHSKEIISGFLRFTYVENTGIAWGMFKNSKTLLILLSFIILAVIIFMLFKFKPKSIIVKTSAGMIIGGALGNIIDRILYGFVIDFLDFNIFNYPVFNLADCFIVVGSILFCIYIIFFDNKKED